MDDLGYPEILVERDGWIAYQEGDNVVIATEDWEKQTTVPLCGCSAYSLAALTLPVFVSGWNRGVASGKRQANHEMASAVRTITDVLKAGGLIRNPDGD